MVVIRLLRSGSFLSVTEVFNLFIVFLKVTKDGNIEQLHCDCFLK